MKKIAKFFVGVKKEMKKVRWLNKKDLAKYSVATITFIVIFMAFFALSDVVLSYIRSVVG
jgi:preprotein translocase SecE subunit